MHPPPSRTAAARPPPLPPTPDGFDRAVPTPGLSGSFSAFQEHTLAIVQEIAEQRAVLASRRTVFAAALLAELDTVQAEALARELARWPEHPPGVIACCGTVQRLLCLQDQIRSYLNGER